LDEGALGRLSALKADWICFGTLHQMNPRARALVKKVCETNPQARRFYDVNLRKDSYEAGLIRELLESATVVKLNDEEVVEIGKMLDLPSGSPREFCEENAKRFGWDAICVTRGEEGCSVRIGDEFVEAPGYRVDVADTVGSGDAFSAGFLHGLGAGWEAGRIADFANRVGALVASRAGAIPRWSLPDVETLRCA
jgi:fructokinase